MSLACERMEGEAVAGKEIDLDTYGTLSDRMGRAFQRLGLKRTARDVTPTPEQFFAHLAAEEERKKASECIDMVDGERIDG